MTAPASIQMHHKYHMHYTNYRGEFGIRIVEPKEFYFGSTKWHPEPQMLMEAWDLEKLEYRLFACKDIKEMNLV